MTSETVTGQSAPCAGCGHPVWPDEDFCEACGAVLTAVQSSSPTPSASVPRGERCLHCDSGTISADGFCETCGRRGPSARDHYEIDLGQLAGVTDRGTSHHRNEDTLTLAAVESPAGPVSIAVVCDGVSSSARGDEAAQLAADAAIAVLVPAARQGQDAADASLQAVQAAQAAVAGLATRPQDTPPHADASSTTFVSAVVMPDAVTVCWLGDSRAYWLDSGPGPANRQLTRDDSLAADLVAAGALTEDEALASPQAHLVTGWLGADASSASPHLVRFALPGPGAVLLCTDGLWNYLANTADLAALAMPGARTDPLGTARMLVDFALKAGGRDNVTVAIAPVPPLPRSAQQSETRRGDE